MTCNMTIEQQRRSHEAFNQPANKYESIIIRKMLPHSTNFNMEAKAKSFLICNRLTYTIIICNSECKKRGSKLKTFECF